MPLYSYACSGCGEFTAWQSMARSDAPAQCPGCAEDAPRAIAAPALALMAASSRVAHARNEKSAHEPKVMSRRQLDKSGRKRSEVLGPVCAHGHAHHNHHHHDRYGHKKLGKGHMVSHKPDRPWMVGH